MSQVVSYHFSPEVYSTAMMYDGQKLPTLLTADATGAAKTASLLTVNKVAAYDFQPYQQTTEVSIIPSGGAPAAIIKPDIPACKVLVQVVDAVLVSQCSSCRIPCSRLAAVRTHVPCFASASAVSLLQLFQTHQISTCPSTNLSVSHDALEDLTYPAALHCMQIPDLTPKKSAIDGVPSGIYGKH